MPAFELTPEIEARIREIVREELRGAETAQRPPWSFDRMDAAMRRVEESRQPTGAPREVAAVDAETLPEAS